MAHIRKKYFQSNTTSTVSSSIKTSRVTSPSFNACRNTSAMTMASAYRPPVQQSKVKQVPTVSITSSDLLRKAFTYSFTEPEQAYNTKKTKTTAQKKVGQLRSQERLPTSKVSGIVNLTEVKAVSGERKSLLQERSGRSFLQNALQGHQLFSVSFKKSFQSFSTAYSTKSSLSKRIRKTISTQSNQNTSSTCSSFPSS